MEIMNGEKPALTNFVGASAVPSQTAAASPQKTPNLWSESVDRVSACVKVPLTNSPQRHKKDDAQNQHHDRNPEMNVGENSNGSRPLHVLTSSLRLK
jgi:hypothetical protein